MSVEIAIQLERRLDRQKEVEEGDTLAQQNDVRDVNVRKDELKPWVQHGVFQTPKGLTKRQVAYQVESTVGEPLEHIDRRFSLITYVVQLRQK